MKKAALFLFFALLCFAAQAQRSNKDTASYKLFDKKGKQVKISDYKGKVVYVGFWASWCGGCKLFMDLSKDLHKKFTKTQLKKIVFIYISIDNDKEAWLKACDKAGVDAVHLISQADLPDGANKYFRVTGLPRYITFDKQGKVADFIAKNPYQTEVYDDLLKLIQE